MSDNLATPEVIERRLQWVEALESGEYEQVQGQLRINNRFCCLGVACDLYSNKQCNYWTDNIYYEEGVEKFIYVPSPTVMEAFGLDDDSICKLAKENDDGKSFKEIASLIRERINEENIVSREE